VGNGKFDISPTIYCERLDTEPSKVPYFIGFGVGFAVLVIILAFITLLSIHIRKLKAERKVYLTIYNNIRN
jgi:hypothetical protein